MYWDKVKRQEGVLYDEIEVRTDMLKTSIFRTFCHESFETSHLITQFGWILNQQTATKSYDTKFGLFG